MILTFSSPNTVNVDNCMSKCLVFFISMYFLDILNFFEELVGSEGLINPESQLKQRLSENMETFFMHVPTNVPTNEIFRIFTLAVISWWE